MAIQIQRKIKIVLTGGGTGGHIYPLLAVADELKKFGEESVEISYLGQSGKFTQEFENRYIRTHKIISSKLRRYFDLRNFLDAPKFIFSVIQALFVMYSVMPDIVFSKGGAGALAVVLAAWFYKIPVVIHESDAVPSLTSILSARFASGVAVSWPSARKEFARGKVFKSGNPIREALLPQWLDPVGGKSYFNFDSKKPMILVLGGSQGSERINNFVLDNLLELLAEVQICHQTGRANFEEVKSLADIVLGEAGEGVRDRYAIRDYLDVKELKLALTAADVVVSRSGAGTIFETAVFGKPMILVPLKESAGDHQRANAYEYAAVGAALVLEEENLTPHVFLNEVKKLVSDPDKIREMSEAAKKFARPDAAKTIAKDLFKMVGVDAKI